MIHRWNVVKVACLAVLGLALAPATSHAWYGYPQGFAVSAWTQVQPTGVSVQVYNAYYNPIVCSGRVHGVTWSGAYGWMQFSMLPILPGMQGFAFINATPVDPIVNSWAEAWCYWY